MEITEESIIGKMVAENYRYASVLKAAEIDFCCNGNRTIKEVCKYANISSENLIKQLSEVAALAVQDVIDYQSWPLDILVDYIEKKHHRYVETQTLTILPLLHKIAIVHKENHPELAEVEALFKESSEGLAMHMKKEELILFPYIRKMTKKDHLSGDKMVPHFGTVRNPITMMQHEHDAEGEIFRKIAALTDNYTPPADACNTYRATLYFLKDFETDLHLHIHLENNIVFPRAIELEKSYL